MRKDDNRAVFNAVVNMPHDTLAISTYEDAISMATHVRADLDGKIAREVTRATVDYMASCSGLSPKMFRMFLEFLGNDPEIQDRFTAYVAAQRILK